MVLSMVAFEQPLADRVCTDSMWSRWSGKDRRPNRDRKPKKMGNPTRSKRLSKIVPKFKNRRPIFGRGYHRSAFRGQAGGGAGGTGGGG